MIRKKSGWQIDNELNCEINEFYSESDSIDQYGHIFVCGPCWWGTYPCAVFTQLERLDFTGKRVFALMTHEGSGLGSCERDLKKMCAGATIGKVLAVRGGSAAKSEKQVADWAKQAVQE